MSTSSEDSYFRNYRYCAISSDEIEDVEKYAPGGYHPVDIGDVISSGKHEYEVIHKLGHGGFATVWLVRSGLQSTSYHALKVLCADKADYIDPELAIFEHLKKVAAAGHPNVVDLHDSFKITGPNGEHSCLVLPVLGPSLRKMRASTALSRAVRHDLCRQVASATAFLHQHGVCHGDITPYNVVFELPGIQSMTLDVFFELLGPIKSERLYPNDDQVEFTPHAPKHVVESPNFLAVDFSSLTRLRLIDFGQAFFVDHPPKSLGTPVHFFPPELCFGFPPSPQSDIWQLGVVHYKILTGGLFLFIGFGSFEELLYMAVTYFGPLPQDWRGRFEFDHYGCREMGKPLNTTEPEYWYEDKTCKTPIAGRLCKEAPHLSTHQQEQFAQLLCGMLSNEPEKRISAVDVVRRLDGDFQAEVAEHSEQTVDFSTLPSAQQANSYSGS